MSHLGPRYLHTRRPARFHPHLISILVFIFPVTIFLESHSTIYLGYEKLKLEHLEVKKNPYVN